MVTMVTLWLLWLLYESEIDFRNVKDCQADFCIG